ncbi:helix-turn-helix domain-containing protein [Priestia megaterium]|uniref:helix-turn-helix domain-containing protein n=1 Tax=Priestia TaxID=2800373 RepID=UPI000E1ABE65|nr:MULTISPECIES: helix-turn-helix domain-containing protein [Priestia]MED5243980.1 helix-turn-helix domain-containing protein [Priestia sp. LL-8]SUV04125.1 AraC family transcriptional regulator [Priestia megaterium]
MDLKLKWEHIEFSCKLINEVANIPIYVMSKDRKLVIEFVSNKFYNPLYSSKEDFLNSIIEFNQTELLPKIQRTDWLENCVVIPIVENYERYGTVILGPTIFPQPTKSSLKELIDFNGIKKSPKAMEDYLQSLKVVSSWKLIHASMLLFYNIYNKRLDFKEIIKENYLTEETKILQDGISDKSIAEIRENATFHQDPIHEKQIYQYIADGNIEEVSLYWRAFHQNTDFQFGRLAKTSELRNQKNQKIASVTLATRAAINGGLHSEVAYTLGDLYIQELELIQNIKDLENFIEHVIYDFTQRVAKSKNMKHSKIVRDCQNYIFKHIYENLTLSKLAHHVLVNPKYLSNLFKKEVGIPITTYIQKIKIEEAKKLMSFSNYSLLEIHALLNFTDQSYFTKVFKTHTGLTPKQYKNKK